MKTFKTLFCSAMLVLIVSTPSFAKSGTISTTKAGTISTTKTGTISTTAGGTVSSGRSGTISTTRTAVQTRANILFERFGILELLFTVVRFR